MYTATDELTHQPTEEQLFSESVYFNLYDPGSGVGGMLRIGNRINLGYAEMTLNMPLPDGSVLFDYRRSEISDNSRLRAGGMELEITEPLARLRLTYAGSAARLTDPAMLATDTRRALKEEPREDCSVRLEWQARTSIEQITPSGDMASGELPLARDHYEQFGSFSGTVEAGADRFELSDAAAFRDHSWGPRDWLAPVYWNQAIISMEDGTCVSASEIGVTETEAAQGGIIITPDGETHTGQQTRIESDYAGEPRWMGPYEVRCTAEDGTTFHARATNINFIPLRHRAEAEDGSKYVQRIGQALSRFESDGVTGWGWTDFWRRLPQEFEP